MRTGWVIRGRHSSSYVHHTRKAYVTESIDAARVYSTRREARKDMVGGEIAVKVAIKTVVEIMPGEVSNGQG